MKREACFEPQRVPRAEAARNDAAREHAIPQRRRVLCHHEELASVLARVPGAVDHAVDPVDLGHRERESRCGREPQPLHRMRPLDGQEGVGIRHVAHVRAGHLPLLQPAEIGGAVRGVDDQQEPEFVELVDDEVVDDPAGIVRQQGVLRLADADLAEVVGERRLQQLGGARPLDLELAHVRDIEHAGVVANGAMLRDYALVLHRHLPAGEGDHARAEHRVRIVQRRSLKDLRHRRRC